MYLIKNFKYLNKPYFEIKKFAFRKIIENTCHFFTNFYYQISQWELIKQQLKQDLEFT